MPAVCANVRATSSSARCRIHFRPEKDRATPNAAALSTARALTDILAAMAGTDPTHRAGGRAHHDALGEDVLACDLNAAQHRTVGHAGRGEHDVARREVHQRIFSVEVRDAELFRTAFFIFLLEYEPRLDLPADTAQRRGGQHALRRTPLSNIDVDTRRWIAGRDHTGNTTIGDKLTG